jgi:HlyD family secretion protein
MTVHFDQAANDFKPDAAALEEAPVPLSAHAALFVVLALLIAAVVWAVVGKVDRIVVAPGKVATRTPMLVMQPFTTSRIVSIDVKPGDHVVKGQVLARFDPAFAQADVSSLQQKVDTLTAQVQRLDAQLSGRIFSAGPDAGPERLTQEQIFGQESADLQSSLSQRDARAAQVRSQIAVDDTNLPGIRRQLGMAEGIVAMYQRLAAQKAAATLDIMRAQSGLVDAQNRLESVSGDREKLIQQQAEISQERQSFTQKWRSDHNQQLVESRQNLAEAIETLSKANRMQDFTQLTAPVGGTVQDVADRSTGSVLKEAETLVTLVPDDADLYVEGQVPARDIGYLKLGDAVRVKLESYPFQRFGTITGVLSVISPDSQPVKEGDDAHRIYKVQVKLDDTARLAARSIRLKPGLVASAEIKTGGETIATYILRPVIRIGDESLREP